MSSAANFVVIFLPLLPTCTPVVPFLDLVYNFCSPPATMEYSMNTMAAAIPKDTLKLLEGCEVRWCNSWSKNTLTFLGSYDAVIELIQPFNSTNFHRVLRDLSVSLYQPDEKTLWIQQRKRSVNFICLPVEENDTIALENVLEIEQSFVFPLDSQVYLVGQQPSTARWGGSLFEVYTVAGNKSFVRELFGAEVGIWDNVSLLSVTELLRLSHRRSNLAGHVIKVVAQRDETYHDAFSGVTSEDGVYNFETGYTLYALHDFQYMLNFTYVAVAGKGWIGRRADTLSNGSTWSLTGMGEQLLTHEADWSVSYNTFATWRIARLYFLPPILYEEGFVYFRQDVAVQSHKNMLRPFSIKLWIAVALLVLSLLAVQNLIQKILRATPSRRRKVMATVQKRERLWPRDCGRPEEECAVSTPVRTVAFTRLTIVYFIQSVYGASILAFLFAGSTLIHTPDDLPTHGYTTFTRSVHHPFAAGLFTNPKDQEELRANTLKYFVDTRDALYKILDGSRKFAYVAAADGLRSAAQKLNMSQGMGMLCSLTSMRNRYAGRVKSAMVLRKGSPLRELFRHRTLKLIEVGLAFRYRLIHSRYTHLDCDNGRQNYQREDPAPARVSLKQCTVAFGLILIGLASAAAIFVFEFCTSD